MPGILGLPDGDHAISSAHHHDDCVCRERVRLSRQQRRADALDLSSRNRVEIHCAPSNLL